MLVDCHLQQDCKNWGPYSPTDFRKLHPKSLQQDGESVFCKTCPDGPSLLPAVSGPISQLWGCKHRLSFPKKSSRRPVNEREEGTQLRRAPTAKCFRVWNSRSFGTIPSGRISEFSALISSADLRWTPCSS